MDRTPLKRPVLRAIPLDLARLNTPGQVTITLSKGQWDGLLEAAYLRGILLLELDDDEEPVAMYQCDDRVH